MFDPADICLLLTLLFGVLPKKKELLLECLKGDLLRKLIVPHLNCKSLTSFAGTCRTARDATRHAFQNSDIIAKHTSKLYASFKKPPDSTVTLDDFEKFFRIVYYDSSSRKKSIADFEYMCSKKDSKKDWIELRKINIEPIVRKNTIYDCLTKCFFLQKKVSFKDEYKDAYTGYRNHHSDPVYSRQSETTISCNDNNQKYILSILKAWKLNFDTNYNYYD
jgi:hypothetical protein